MRLSECHSTHRGRETDLNILPKHWEADFINIKYIFDIVCLNHDTTILFTNNFVHKSRTESSAYILIRSVILFKKLMEV